MGTSSVMVGHCQKCHASIGELTREELDYVVFEARDQLLCFDCDQLAADSIPGIFEDIRPDEILCLGDLSLELKENELGHGNLFPSRAHERTHARGLSSVTYLNGILQDSGVLEFIDRGKHCLTCDGFGEYWYLDKQVTCSACGGIGRIGDKVLLPLWLVSGVRENA